MEDDLRQLIHQLDPATYTRAADLLSDRNWHLTAENLAQAIVELREADQTATQPPELPDREARERDLTTLLHRTRRELHPDPHRSSDSEVSEPTYDVHPADVDLEEYELQRDEEIAADTNEDLARYDAADAETRGREWPGLTRTDLEERAAAADATLQRRRELIRRSTEDLTEHGNGGTREVDAALDELDRFRWQPQDPDQAPDPLLEQEPAEEYDGPANTPAEEHETTDEMPAFPLFERDLDTAITRARGAVGNPHPVAAERHNDRTRGDRTNPGPDLSL